VRSSSVYDAAEAAVPFDALRALKARVVEIGDVDELGLPGLSERRRSTFPGGLMDLSAHMEALGRFSRGNVLAALHHRRRPVLARALLPALLEKKDAIGNIRPVSVPVKPETRWCDWAAAILARALPELAFEEKAPVESRDRQIEAMRAKLSKASPSVR